MGLKLRIFLIINSNKIKNSKNRLKKRHIITTNISSPQTITQRIRMKPFPQQIIVTKRPKSRTPSPPKTEQSQIENKIDDESDGNVSGGSTPTLSSASSRSVEHNEHDIITPQHALITNDDSDSQNGSRSDTPLPKSKKFVYVKNDNDNIAFSEDQEQEFDPLD